MYIEIKNNSLLSMLLEDMKYATGYFSTLDIGKFTGIELNRLKFNVRNSKNEEEKVYAENELCEHETHLAYLLICGIINVEKAVKLKYDREYLEELIIKHQKTLNNLFTKYYYDEKTRKVYVIDESGKMRPLPYIPIIITNKINETYEVSKYTIK